MIWGFLAYGRIARKMEESLNSSQECTLLAIASSSQYDQIPDKYRKYRNYQDLLNDPEIEIVYISTTHNNHAVWTIKALEAGKHVLCEKPLTISRAAAHQMIQAAESNKKFLMEAIWSRYLPGYRKAIDLVKQGAIGDVQMIQANFCFAMNPNEPKERLIDPDLAAGAIWDVGIYPLSLVLDLVDAKVQRTSIDGHLSPLGIENRCAWQYHFDNGVLAQLTCAVDLTAHNLAIITGTKGHIVMDDFWKCETFQLTREGKTERFYLPFQSTGLYHEAIACQKLIESGKPESPLITWQDSLQLNDMMLSLLEQIRK